MASRKPSAHFTIEVAEHPDLSAFEVNGTGSGNEQHPSEMMTGMCSCVVTQRGGCPGRVIEAATYTDVAARYICGNGAHPDHQRERNEDTCERGQTPCGELQAGGGMTGEAEKEVAVFNRICRSIDGMTKTILLCKGSILTLCANKSPLPELVSLQSLPAGLL
jgi:hypothetical protein